MGGTFHAALVAECVPPEPILRSSSLFFVAKSKAISAAFAKLIPQARRTAVMLPALAPNSWAPSMPDVFARAEAKPNCQKTNMPPPVVRTAIFGEARARAAMRGRRTCERNQGCRFAVSIEPFHHGYARARGARCEPVVF